LLNKISLVSTSQKHEFFESFALMVSSGIGVKESLESLEQESLSRGTKILIRRIREDINNGHPLWYALLQVNLLPLHLLAVLQITEESGKLNENMSVVVDYLKRENEFKSKLRSASIYPGFVLTLLFVITLVLGTFVLPNLAKTYSNLNVDLPKVTVFVINAGEFLDKQGYVVIPVLIFFIFSLVYLIFVNKDTKRIGQAILLRTPIVNKLIKETEILRFGYLLNILLDSGMTLLDGLHLLSIATPYHQYARFYAKLADNIDQGLGFSESFNGINNANRLFPLYVRQMIISGEKTASLKQSLEKIGEVYTIKSDTTGKNISVMIEPVLLLLVWAMVAVIAFAVVMPIYNLTNSITDVSTDNNQLEEETNYKSLEIIGNGKIKVFNRPDGTQIALVDSGNLYLYTQERSGWYEIILERNSTGWVEKDNISLID